MGCFQTDTGSFGNFSLQVQILSCYSHFHLFLLHGADPLHGAAAQGSCLPSQGAVWGEEASLFLKGKEECSPLPQYCLLQEAPGGNKITGESFLETHPCREPLGQPPLSSSPPQRFGLSEKLENEEQGAVSPKCSLSCQGHHHPIPCRWTPHPVISSSHVQSAQCTSQNTQTEGNRDTAGEPSPFVTAARLGAPYAPLLHPKGTPRFRPPPRKQHCAQRRSPASSRLWYPLLAPSGSFAKEASPGVLVSLQVTRTHGSSLSGTRSGFARLPCPTLPCLQSPPQVLSHVRAGPKLLRAGTYPHLTSSGGCLLLCEK